MKAIMSQIAGQDYFALRHRYTEDAYERHLAYNGGNQKTLDKLEVLLTAKKELEIAATGEPRMQQLGAGQVKQVVLPLGKTLEETIELWKGVRSEAISVPEPTTADYQLAAKASSQIRKTEAQIGLHQQAKFEVDLAEIKEGATKMADVKLPSKMDRGTMEIQKRFEQAVSSYTFHVQMKKKGFEIELPSFYRIA